MIAFGLQGYLGELTMSSYAVSLTLMKARPKPNANQKILSKDATLDKILY